MAPPSSADLSAVRREYDGAELRRADLDQDPVRQFARWFEEGSDTVLEPNAMALATADRSGRPSVRMVLLKGFDADGFVFATSYQSRKAGEIGENPQAALLFYWPSLERQVRIAGKIEMAEPTRSDSIFMARPRGSRLAAAASAQSQPIESREAMESVVAKLAAELEGREVDRPPFWGAYRVVPDEFEFWQGRRNRLHDRFLYTREATDWMIRRLQP